MGKWEKRGRYHPWCHPTMAMAGKSSMAGLRFDNFFAAKNKPPWLAGSALPADAGVVVVPCGMENPCNLEASWLCGWWRCRWWLWCWCRVSFRNATSNDQNPWVFPSLETVSAGEMRLDPPSPVESQSREARVAWGTTWCTSCDQPKMYQFLVSHVSKIYSYLSHRSHDPDGEVPLHVFFFPGYFI